MRKRRNQLRSSLLGISTGLLLLLSILGTCQAQDAAMPDILAEPQAAAGAANNGKPSFLRNLTVTGFLSATYGTFIDSEAIEYNKSKNSLSSARQLLQLDVNNTLGEHDRFFMRDWFVYEPNYPFENTCPQRFGPAGDCNSDFYNQYGIRELWLQDTRGPLQIFIGRQILTWGESISFRVGDQINPVDTSWAFGFANLEQSRIPLWMLHPILDLPDAGPFGSNFLEVAYIPGVDFLYTQVDVPPDTIDGQDQVAGRVNISAPTGSRFAGRPDNRCDPGLSLCVGGIVNAFNRGLAQPPFSTLILHGFSPDTQTTIPRATWANSQVGVRFHTLVYNTEMTTYFLYSHNYSPTAEVAQIEREPLGAIPGLRRVNLNFPKYASVAATANRPLYLPGALAQLPFVLRGEVFYKNHNEFNTLEPALHWPAGSLGSFVAHSDQILWLAALDLSSASAPWLTATGTLNANLEIMGTATLNGKNIYQVAPGYLNRLYNNDINMLLNVGTSWYWGAIAPTWTMIYNPNGTTFEFFPGLLLTPTWTDKYFMTLKYIGILGTDAYGLDGGIFKGKSMFISQFQYNFSLL
jgi:hypothetical protein